jgi:DNA-binding transcriptional MerR regulator
MSSQMMTAEVARYLEVVPNTVRLYEASGLLPAQRTATGVRIFRRLDVEAFAKRRAEKRVATSDRKRSGGK